MMDCSRTPPFSSHSGASGVHPHPRNLDDEQIRAVAARGGIVGVIFVSAVSRRTVLHAGTRRPTTSNTSPASAARTASRWAPTSTASWSLPRGLRDAADLPRLTELLWRRGWREPRLGKLLGGNALRYLS